VKAVCHHPLAELVAYLEDWMKLTVPTKLHGRYSLLKEAPTELQWKYWCDEAVAAPTEQMAAWLELCKHAGIPVDGLVSWLDLHHPLYPKMEERLMEGRVGSSLF
jgi:hypothetical protein